MKSLVNHRGFLFFQGFAVTCRTPHVVVSVKHPNVVQSRSAHDSHLPKGRGGRSSFSGMVATVFGGTGGVGHSVLNRLGSKGSNVMVPYRGTFDRVRRIRMMADLGQFLLREEFSIKQDDDAIRDLIEHSNCVINLIGTRKEMNHYTMQEVNVEWPKRLARLVAEKNDGTRLLHLTHLNSPRADCREASNILQQNWEAENAMREIYPDTIIVRSAHTFGFYDHFSKLLLHKNFNNFLADFGALPLLYDAGKSTVVQPVYVGDVAEGITRVLRHPDGPAQTFEFVGPKRFTLHDFTKYLYDATQRDSFLFNSLGPMDRSQATFMQNIVHRFVEYYFWRMDKPSIFKPRVLDLITRTGSPKSMWMTFDYYKQLHLTDRTTGLPGMKELGIEPSQFEEVSYDYLTSMASDDFDIRSENAIIPEAKEEQEVPKPTIQPMLS